MRHHSRRVACGRTVCSDHGCGGIRLHHQQLQAIGDARIALEDLKPTVTAAAARSLVTTTGTGADPNEEFEGETAVMMLE